MKRIYMDHAATSPLHPQALEAMMPFFSEHFGNPSSTHYYGRKAKFALEEARRFFAGSIGADEKEIIFTSGGTEANNLAIFGFVEKNFSRGHIITTQIEHHSVLRCFEQLEEKGFDVTYLPAGEDGIVDVEDLKQAIRDDTVFVSIMFANNETGAIQPIAKISSILRKRNIVFHVDAVQTYGTIRFNVHKLGIHFLSASGHKLSGPKGVGFLYAKHPLRISPLFFGGDQERKRRAGTENVPGIVGFMEAAKIAFETLDERAAKYAQFKEEMIRIWRENGIDFIVNGDLEQSLPHILNISFPGTHVASMLANLDLAGICASSGSACTAGSAEPSHVLRAMGSSEERLQSAIRFSFGYGNTLEEVQYVAQEAASIAKRLCHMR